VSVAFPDIVILGPAHPLRGGGLTSYNERLAREWQRMGHKVTIYSFSLQYPGFLFPGTTQYSSEPAPTDLDIRVKVNSINPLNWIAVGRELKKLKPDIIIVRYWLPFMGPCLGTILRIAKKNKHTKVVCIADNVIPHEKRPGDTVFTKYFLKACDAFITMSEKVMTDLQQFVTHKPAQLVPHPLYDNFGEPVSKAAARAQLGIGNNERLLLFFGFIRQYKGLDILLDAMKLLQGKNIRLLVAGEFYEDAKPYHEQIARLGIADDLILKTNFITDSEVKYYLCAADVVVQPYRNATQSGVTPLAYHFEKPMIVTNVGGLPALVPHEEVGLVTEPDAAALAKTILHYFELGENHFIPNLQREKEKYSWKKMVESIIALAAAVSK
jgi:glycosyltransferase involved in cell wall biosynthesis